MKMNKLSLMLGLCLLTLTGCQNDGKEGKPIEEVHLEGEQQEEKQMDEEVQKEFDGIPSTDNPEKFFQDIDLSVAYKNIGYHNPIMSQRFGADPFAMVYGDRVYVYMTNDIVEYDGEGNPKENTYGLINSLNVISSADLVNWTDHGSVKVNESTIWARNSWAPAAIHKKIDGKDQFFIYFANNGSSIGVLRSDSPTGPFVDPLAKPLITREVENTSDVVWLFDPAVFTDDDGKSYLYFGGGVPGEAFEMPNTARVVELGEDMISLADTPVTIEAPFMFENSGINKIGDTYYYTYCSNWGDRDNALGPHKPNAGEVIYMTSDSPMGPWEYQGSILQNPGRFFGSYGNNHHSIIQFKGQWYIFYHTQVLADSMKITGGYRSTHIDKVTISEDGVINPIKPTKFGVDQVRKLNPYQSVEAETMAWMGGVFTTMIDEPSVEYGRTNLALSDITTGDWIALSGVDFGVEGPKTFTAKVASEKAGNFIKIVIDKPSGECIGYLEVPNTGSEDAYVEVTIPVEAVTGEHNLYFIFSGEGFFFDSWEFAQ